MEKKDKVKVLDEVWTPERIKSFLDLIPPTGTNADFHVLYSAYKSMRSEDFAILVNLFHQAGRDFSATNSDNLTVVDIIKQHRHGNDYAEVITSLM